MANTPTNPFLTFDATELKTKIVQKLNSNQVFTDQNYEGSNLSALIDIISYSFGTLLYYLNKTTSESMFSEAQLYENMNRIVKLLNYNPIGKISQTVPIQLTASADLTKNIYVIPRFSYFILNNVTFSLGEDLTFSKFTDLEETLSEIDSNYLLHEGTFEEYPLYNALGIPDETIFLSAGEEISIDHFNIHVFVKKQGSVWKKWTRVEDRSSNRPSDTIYQVRFNHNKNYEIVFGDDINGNQLQPNDEVGIYYLKINPKAPTVSTGTLNGQSLVPFNSLQFERILNDTKNLYGTYLTPTELDYVTLNNPFPSNAYYSEENVESIRKNAPKVFRSQHRLVTSSDYEAFANTNFKNLILNAKILNNEEFLRTHIKYLHEIGLANPQLDNQVLFNQVKFASSCNFNNIYVYSIPTQNSKYLLPTQKEYIVKEFNKYKGLTTQMVMMDPEYMHFDFYVQIANEIPSVDKLPFSKLKIYKEINNKRSNSSIKFDVVNTILEAFNKQTLTLGQDIDSLQLTTNILSIDGVKNIQTARTDTNVAVNELSFLVWNAKYPSNDAKIYTQKIYIDDFMVPFLHNPSNLADRIEIVDVGYGINVPEF